MPFKIESREEPVPVIEIFEVHAEGHVIPRGVTVIDPVHDVTLFPMASWLSDQMPAFGDVIGGLVYISRSP